MSELLAKLENQQCDTEIVLFSITLIEPEHGLHRAPPERERREYLDTVFAAVPMESFTTGRR